MTEELDVETPLQACRCRMPQKLATIVQARLEANGFQVAAATDDVGRVVLRVSRMQVVRFRVQRNREAIGVAEAEAVVAAVVDDLHVSSVFFRRSVRRHLAEAVRRSWLLEPEWLPVFDARTLTRTGVELLAFNDGDASRQLDVLAPALDLPAIKEDPRVDEFASLLHASLLNLPRDAFTVKPRRGWQGYGLPTT